MSTVTPHPRSSRRVIGYTLIAAAVFLLAGEAAFAQESGQAPESVATIQNSDPPGRVARLNYTAGAVTTEPADATDWSYAQINRPLTTGDQLWNDQNARSELHIGSTAVRLGSSTSLDLLNLDDNNAQLKVAQGTLSARVRELAPGSSYEIDTPNLALDLSGPGDYRVDVAPDGSSTTVTVRSGGATVYGDGAPVTVVAGQQIRFGGTGLQQLAVNGAPGLDGFDQWAASRDAAEDRSVSARYVSRDIPGYEDLDANGTWRSTPQYGDVWVPRATPVGWAPYRDGHWVWQAPWGWTWVDDAPWGFAPYHYGRWAQIDDTWAWVPGPVAVSEPPVYAPALVAFVGGGGASWGVDLAIGGAIAAGVAWFPLGPGEPWHPHWGGHDHWSPGYYNRVNRTTVVNNYNRNANVTNVHNTYVNYRAPGGVTAVPATAFVHGQPVGRFAQKVDPRQWRNAQINPGGPGIAPVRESFGPGLRNANYRPPATVMTRPVMATRSPAMPPAYHDSLAQRFAQSGARVPGAGQPVVRTSVPAHMAGAPSVLPMQNVRVVQSHIAGRAPGMAPGAPAMGGRPGEVAGAGGTAGAGGPSGSGVMARQAGQPLGEMGGARGLGGTGASVQQAGQRSGEMSGLRGPGGTGAMAQRPGEVPHGGVPQARPDTVPPQVAAQHPLAGEAGRPSNGVPRPPQAGFGGNPAAAAQQGQQRGFDEHHQPAWTQPHAPMAQQAQPHGAPPPQGARPEFAQQPRAQPGAQQQQHGGPRSVENPAAQQQQQTRQQEIRTQAQAPAPRPAEIQTQQPPRQEYHPQPMQPMQQAQQQPRPEFHPQPMPQPRAEPRPPQAQQQPRQEFHPPQQAQPQQPRPQPVQQPQQSGPQVQPQRAEQRPGGGNRDEHHKG